MKRRDFLIAGSTAGLAASVPLNAQNGDKDSVKIAAFQGKCSQNFDENLEKVISSIKKYGQKGTDFICFPEGYLSNYSSELAVELSDKRIEKLIRVSGQFDMVSIVGVSEKRSDTATSNY